MWNEFLESEGGALKCREIFDIFELKSRRFDMNSGTKLSRTSDLFACWVLILTLKNAEFPEMPFFER